MEPTNQVQPKISIPRDLSTNNEQNIIVKNSPTSPNCVEKDTNIIEVKSELNCSIENNTHPSVSNAEVTNDEGNQSTQRKQDSRFLFENQRKNAAFYFSDAFKRDVENISNETQLVESKQEVVSNDTQSSGLNIHEDLHNCESASTIKLVDDMIEINQNDSNSYSSVIYLNEYQTNIQDSRYSDISSDSELQIMMNEDSFASFEEYANVDTTLDKTMPIESVNNHFNYNLDHLPVTNDSNKDCVQNILRTLSPSEFSEVKIIMDEEDSSFLSINYEDGQFLQSEEDTNLDTTEEIVTPHIKQEFVSDVPIDKKLQRNLEFEKEPDLRELLQSRRQKYLEFEPEPDLRQLIMKSRSERIKQKVSDLQLQTENQEKTIIKQEKEYNDIQTDSNETLSTVVKEEFEDIDIKEEFPSHRLIIEDDIEPINFQTHVANLKIEENNHINSLSDVIIHKSKLTDDLSQTELKSSENSTTNRTVDNNRSLAVQNNSAINIPMEVTSQIEQNCLENNEKRTRRSRRRRRGRNKQLENKSNIQNDSTKEKEEPEKDKANDTKYKETPLQKELVKSCSQGSYTENNVKHSETRLNSSNAVNKQESTSIFQYDINTLEKFGVPKCSMKTIDNDNLKTIIKLKNNQNTTDKVSNKDRLSNEVKSIKKIETKSTEKLNNKSTVDKEKDKNNVIKVKNIDTIMKEPNKSSNVETVSKSNCLAKEIAAKTFKLSFRTPKRKDPLPPDNPTKRVKLVRPDTVHNVSRHNTPDTRHLVNTSQIQDPRCKTPVAKVAPRPRSPVRAPAERPRSWEEMWGDMVHLQERLVQAEDWKRQCDEELAKWDKELDKCNQQLARIRARKNLATIACENNSVNNSRGELKQTDPRIKTREVISVSNEEWIRQNNEELERYNKELDRIRERRDLASIACVKNSASNSRCELKETDPRNINTGVFNVTSEEWRQKELAEKMRRNLSLNGFDQQDPTLIVGRRRRKRTRTRRRRNNDATATRDITDPRLPVVGDGRCTIAQERQGQTEQPNQELEDSRQSILKDLKITSNGSQRLLDPSSEAINISTSNKNLTQSILHIQKDNNIRSLLDIDPWTL